MNAAMWRMKGGVEEVQFIVLDGCEMFVCILSWMLSVGTLQTL